MPDSLELVAGVDDCAGVTVEGSGAHHGGDSAHSGDTLSLGFTEDADRHTGHLAPFIEPVPDCWQCQVRIRDWKLDVDETTSPID